MPRVFAVFADNGGIMGDNGGIMEIMVPKRQPLSLLSTDFRENGQNTRHYPYYPPISRKNGQNTRHYPIIRVIRVLGAFVKPATDGEEGPFGDQPLGIEPHLDRNLFGDNPSLGAFVRSSGTFGPKNGITRIMG